MDSLPLLILLLRYVFSTSAENPAHLKFDLAKATLDKEDTSLESQTQKQVNKTKVRRATGQTSGRLHRRAEITTLVTRKELEDFFDDFSPPRSTLPPSTSARALLRGVSTATPKAIVYELATDSPLRRKVAKETRQLRRSDGGRRVGGKVFKHIGISKTDPLPVDQEAAKYLTKILLKEADSMRKNILRRKIEETKQDVKRLEVAKRKSNPLGSMEFEDELARNIEEQELNIQNHHNLERSSGFFNGNNIPAGKTARIRSSGPTFWVLKKKGGGYSSHFKQGGGPLQTKVSSSPVIIENTTPLPQQWAHITDGEVRKWTRARPFAAPTMLPYNHFFTSTSHPFAFGAVNVDGEFRRPLPSLPSLIQNTIPVIDNDIIHSDINKPPYPFSHCYMNKDGLMCCNRFLESLLRKSYQKLQRSVHFQRSRLQNVAARLQRDCEHVFNTTFEVVVGADDYALRAHFAGDLMCKIEQDNKYITVYATNMPTREGSQKDPLNVITPIALNSMDEMQTSTTVTNSHNVLGGEQNNLPLRELSREDVEDESFFFE